ncbi:MAG: hypothetical protein NVSMB51_00010 [Solirubrobacteraceae bacterium]
MRPSASVIVPTRGRPGYLDVALASISGQCEDILVIEDGPAGACEAVAARHGARYHALGARRGLNIARNAGLARTSGELAVFVDDDIRAAPGWLTALQDAAAAHPEIDIFTGPIRARFEDHPLRSCGREGPPITAMDLGTEDCAAPRAWGANMAIRRAALATTGTFDERRSGGGDEEEWQERHGGPVRYVAAAAVEHRRAGDDARLRSLMRSAYRRGREVREFDERAGRAPQPAAELRTLLGCLWHTVRRRCANGPVMAAHSTGRLLQALGRPDPPVAEHDFLSGESGTVGGRRDVLRSAGDLLLDAQLRLRGGANGGIPRRLLVLSIARPAHAEMLACAWRELQRSRHAVELAQRPPGELGKFENLNAMLAGRELTEIDWLLVLDDDVVLPRGFLDRFIALAERCELQLAQPAHRLRSHAAWRLTRRQAGCLVRETRFVEIGPVTALHRTTFPILLPFPELRMGWGLDAHWSALAVQHGWRLGVVDGAPIAHLAAPAASAYSREQAIEEARAFLATHPYLPVAESQRTVRRCA